jgi:hypothetical protein
MVKASAFEMISEANDMFTVIELAIGQFHSEGGSDDECTAMRLLMQKGTGLLDQAKDMLLVESHGRLAPHDACRRRAPRR